MTNATSACVITPDWPAPKNVRAISTTRQGGGSSGPYMSNNLALHVGDDEQCVLQNRSNLMSEFQLPESPAWMNQVHGDKVLAFDDASGADADACYSSIPGQVCAVMTADCLPVLFANQQANKVAAAHAGWRGLHAGILENTFHQLQTPADQILVWLGPAIGPKAFEVGEEVKQAFVSKQRDFQSAFTSQSNGKYLADIYELARKTLKTVGIEQVYGGDYCTYHESDRFYSYRRDGICGRMASLIWLDN